MDPDLHTPILRSHAHSHVHAPVAPDGFAGNDAGVSSAGETYDAGDPPASEAPQPPVELDDVQPTSTSMSTSTSTATATTVTAKAMTERAQHEVVADASASIDDIDNAGNTRDIDDTQRQSQQDQSRDQPHTGSPSSLACAPPLSSEASSQSLVLLTAGAAAAAANSGREGEENKASTPPVGSSPLGSPSMSPAPTRSPSPPSPSSLAKSAKFRRQSPAREGKLVVRASSRSSSATRAHQVQVQRRDSQGIVVPWSLDDLPNEVLLHILGFLDVNDILATSRIRATLPPLLASPMRPSLADLISRHIFMTNTTVVSRKLARSLVSIRLSRRLAQRPPAQLLVERCVLPPECAPGIGHVAPALAARTRAVERERLKDGLRHWIGAVWKREVGRRSERIRRFDESVGVGKVWRLRKFWERVSHDNEGVAQAAHP
ncbi:hypothetical protein Sste5346_003377 [Sporothrix stenoceras]|uniref:F-box domain-containing protein n=1 Tax=Sporothrix stenoceras TaxID=5173 RepID=A0ABR3ZFZ3_9PEZI